MRGEWEEEGGRREKEDEGRGEEGSREEREEGSWGSVRRGGGEEELYCCSYVRMKGAYGIVSIPPVHTDHR